MKAALQVSIGGVAAFFLWKLAALLVPVVFGVVVGLLAFVLKVLFVLGLLLALYLAYRWSNRHASP